MAKAAKRGLSNAVPALITGAAALAIAGAAILAVSAPQPAAAKPEFAAKTGLPCGQCHVSATGGGPLKPFGEAYKANGYNVPK